MSVEWELKFQAPAPPFKNFWLRFCLQSPGWNQLCLEMNKCFGSLFLQMELHSFCCFFVLTELPLYFINMEIFKLK